MDRENRVFSHVKAVLPPASLPCGKMDLGSRVYENVHRDTSLANMWVIGFTTTKGIVKSLIDSSSGIKLLNLHQSLIEITTKTAIQMQCNLVSLL